MDLERKLPQPLKDMMDIHSGAYKPLFSSAYLGTWGDTDLFVHQGFLIRKKAFYLRGPGSLCRKTPDHCPGALYVIHANFEVNLPWLPLFINLISSPRLLPVTGQKMPFIGVQVECGLMQCLPNYSLSAHHGKN